jgi:hypothetical protein
MVRSNWLGRTAGQFRSIVVQYVSKATTKHEQLAVRVICQSQIKGSFREICQHWHLLGRDARLLIRLLGIRRSCMPFAKTPLYEA